MGVYEMHAKKMTMMLPVHDERGGDRRGGEFAGGSVIFKKIIWRERTLSYNDDCTGTMVPWYIQGFACAISRFLSL